MIPFHFLATFPHPPLVAARREEVYARGILYTVYQLYIEYKAKRTHSLLTATLRRSETVPQKSIDIIASQSIVLS